MRKGQSQSNTLAGGVEWAPKISLPNRDSGFPYSDYVVPDYCFSCAYFESLKGHFGGCREDYKRGVYDGSKKGSACGGWRIKSDWMDEGFKIPEPLKPQRKILIRRTDAAWVFEKLGSVIPAELPAARRLLEGKTIGRGHGFGSRRTQKVKEILSEKTKAAWKRGDFGDPERAKKARASKIEARKQKAWAIWGKLMPEAPRQPDLKSQEKANWLAFRRAWRHTKN